jgi:hypothetical protein
MNPGMRWLVVERPPVGTYFVPGDFLAAGKTTFLILQFLNLQGEWTNVPVEGS